jgi:hypothetical protein
MTAPCDGQIGGENMFKLQNDRSGQWQQYVAQRNDVLKEQSVLKLREKIGCEPLFCSKSFFFRYQSKCA